MRISSFLTLTDAVKRGDLMHECMASAEGFSDELVVVEGSTRPIKRTGFYEAGKKDLYVVNHKWPYEFSWEFIGQQFQRGYEAASGDWVVHLDCDFIFHERDYGRIRQALRDYPTAPAVSFYKWQFILPDRYNLKSRLAIAVNKGAFGERIKFNGGGDLCQPTLDGQELNLNELPQAGVAFFNYEHLKKTKDQITEDVSRMDRAYYRHFGEWLYSKDGNAFDGWLQMVAGRFQKPSERITLDKHPQVMHDTIRSLKPDQFGYNGFGLIKGRVYA